MHIHCSQESLVTGSRTPVSYAELCLSFPQSGKLWAAKTAAQWLRTYIQMQSFEKTCQQAGLREYLANPSLLQTISPLYDSNLARLIVLHAVGSMVKDHLQSKGLLLPGILDTPGDPKKPKLYCHTWNDGAKAVRHGRQYGMQANLFASLCLCIYGTMAQMPSSSNLSSGLGSGGNFQIDGPDSPVIQRWIILGSGTPMLGSVTSASTFYGGMPLGATRSILLRVRDLLYVKASQKSLLPLVTGICDLLCALSITKQREPRCLY
ncbi:uncharacterized protein BO88DRAFT_465461 [Aspergillus vadensis CBS 113365]|uniref:Uncharacterized protein n=1 Tax=Aspergillus vadensis (strain CBS 113365 / IMI 142717 / IBT 24658) TaxID=1448311 RepID=A0A319BAW6_ASPVC|nr:hypothetical protein BO88DRAFT_465461 [Aspergillus vadensis CBS 113365]PYH67650.1 hypothetical protein BO88DRAFT_465461 [Aspergillus vadensis CBS 113365]